MPARRCGVFHPGTTTELDVYADRDLLEPVLINLLRNAWQAQEKTASPVVRLGGRLNRRQNIVIEVSDNGPGIPANIATKIFVPFFTTREKRLRRGACAGSPGDDRARRFHPRWLKR